MMQETLHNNEEQTPMKGVSVPHNQQQKLAANQRNLGGLLSLINSPWLLITLPLLIGGVWLANNTWVITSNLDKPYALLAGPATVGSVLVVYIIIAFFKVIASWCRGVGQAFLSWKKQEGSSFWMVIYVFLMVSVLESGAFFNVLLGPNSLFDSLGYASAFVIDLVAVECMRARQGAVRMRDRQGERIYQLGVVVCAMISAFANGYTALLHWHEPTGTLVPILMIKVAPLIGVIFPLLMVFLSFAGDYTADQASSKLNPEEYEISEQKRIRLLEIQRDKLTQRVRIEKEIDQLTGQMHARKEKRVFFLIAWLFPKEPANAVQIAAQIREELGKDLQSLHEKIQSELEQAFTEERVRIQNVEGSLKIIELNLPQLLDDWKNTRNTTVLSTKKGRESGVNRGANARSHGSANLAQIAETQGQKSLAFSLTSNHKKVLEWIRNRADWRSQFAQILRTNPQGAFDEIATFLRGNGLNYSYITGPFIAEVLSLLQLMEEREQTAKEQNTAKTRERKETHREQVNTVNGPLTQVNASEQPVNSLMGAQTGERVHQGQAQQYSGTNEENGERVTDPEQAAIATIVPTTPAPQLEQDERSISPEIATNMDTLAGVHTEAIGTNNREPLTQPRGSVDQENPGGFSEAISSKSGAPFSDSEAILHSPDGNTDEFGANSDEDLEDFNDETGTDSERSTRRGQYHLTAIQITEKYACNLEHIKYSVEHGQLRLSNRTNQESDPIETWRILTSSLEGWTPPQLPRKRGRKPKNQQELVGTR